MENQDFIIDKVSWHVQRERNYPFDNEIIYAYFKSIINYLQSRELTTGLILTSDESVTKETCIRKSDLTEVGLLLIKKCYDKWVDGIVDRGKDVNDYRLLDRHLELVKYSLRFI